MNPGKSSLRANEVPAKIRGGSDELSGGSETIPEIASVSPGTLPRNDVGKSFTESIKQLNHETDLEGQKWFREKRKVRLLIIFWRMAVSFFRIYFFQGGLREGFFGFMRAVHGSLFLLLSYTKYWELIERERGSM